jgi:hypothetical protein
MGREQFLYVEVIVSYVEQKRGVEDAFLNEAFDGGTKRRQPRSCMGLPPAVG